MSEQPQIVESGGEGKRSFRYEIRPTTLAGHILMHEWPIYDTHTERQVGFFPWDQQAQAILTCEALNRDWERGSDD